MAEDQVDVFAEVDAHRDVHVAAVVDSAGRVLGSAPFRTDLGGYKQLHGRQRTHGHLVRVRGRGHRQLRRRPGLPSEEEGY